MSQIFAIRWPKYWSFSISPSNEHPGLVFFSMDWLDLLAVQGTLENLIFNLEIQLHLFQFWNFSLVYLPNIFSAFFFWNFYYSGIGHYCPTLNFLAFFFLFSIFIIFLKSSLSCNCIIKVVSLALIFLSFQGLLNADYYYNY